MVLRIANPMDHGRNFRLRSWRLREAPTWGRWVKDTLTTTIITTATSLSLGDCVVVVVVVVVIVVVVVVVVKISAYR